MQKVNTGCKTWKYNAMHAGFTNHLLHAAEKHMWEFKGIPSISMSRINSAAISTCDICRFWRECKGNFHSGNFALHVSMPLMIHATLSVGCYKDKFYLHVTVWGPFNLCICCQPLHKSLVPIPVPVGSLYNCNDAGKCYMRAKLGLTYSSSNSGPQYSNTTG